MYQRILSARLLKLFQQFPIVGVLGPRQSGKTTLARHCFPNLPYVNLEDLTVRDYAEMDPKGFLANYPQGAILDEIQHVPHLFSYLQVITDQTNQPGQFVVTGSHSFILSEKISQSLAGRIALTTLLPLAYQELSPTADINTILFQGFYPRLHVHHIDPADFYQSYVQTYVEKDLRQLINVADLSVFQRFLKLCAGRVGQIVNFSSLGSDAGISHVSVKKWLSLLEASYILFQLQPYHENFSKRVVKAPKLYFYDTGLLCHLLGIRSAGEIDGHHARGAIFENFVIADTKKCCFSFNQINNLYFWRDSHGREIDLLVEKNSQLIPVEIKSGQTISSDYTRNIEFFDALKPSATKMVIYQGVDKQTRKGITIAPWPSGLQTLWE